MSRSPLRFPPRSRRRPVVVGFLAVVALASGTALLASKASGAERPAAGSAAFASTLANAPSAPDVTQLPFPDGDSPPTLGITEID